MYLQVSVGTRVAGKLEYRRCSNDYREPMGNQGFAHLVALCSEIEKNTMHHKQSFDATMHLLRQYVWPSGRQAVRPLGVTPKKRASRIGWLLLALLDQNRLP